MQHNVRKHCSEHGNKISLGFYSSIQEVKCATEPIQLLNSRQMFIWTVLHNWRAWQLYKQPHKTFKKTKLQAQCERFPIWRFPLALLILLYSIRRELFCKYLPAFWQISFSSDYTLKYIKYYWPTKKSQTSLQKFCLPVYILQYRWKKIYSSWFIRFNMLKFHIFLIPVPLYT